MVAAVQAETFKRDPKTGRPLPPQVMSGGGASTNMGVMLQYQQALAAWKKAHPPPPPPTDNLAARYISAKSQQPVQPLQETGPTALGRPQRPEGIQRETPDESTPSGSIASLIRRRGRRGGFLGTIFGDESLGGA